MKQHTLKPGQAPFEMVDGPLAGKRYERGKVYAEIPTEHADRFAAVPEAAANKTTQPETKKAPATRPGASTEETT